MEIKFINYTYKDKKLSFTIESSSILGITGTGKEKLGKLIALKQLNKGQLIIDGVKITKDNINEYRKKVVFIPKELNTSKNTVLNLLNEYVIKHKIYVKDPTKKIKDAIKIVGLPEDILNKKIFVLSYSEKKTLQLAMALLTNPEVIVIEEPFKGLDKDKEKSLVMLMQRLKEQFSRTIVIITDDSNILYKYTTNMFFIKNDEILLSGKTDEQYLRVDFLKRNRFEIPQLVEFSYLANKQKNAKIDYHKDVRDIIKDIYKHI